jgi:release factor glutamine methyltransferase
VTAGEALRKYTSILKQYGLDEAEEDARVLLCHVLGLTTAQLFAQSDRVLSAKEASLFEEFINKRLDKVPAAYLVKSRGFYGLDFYVDSRVLIPRPETEVLVDGAIKFSHQWQRQKRGTIRIADVGTGSGAIAIALASNINDSIIYAVDISSAALQVAAMNIKTHKMENRVKLVQGHLLQQITEKLDLVVANLPYIKKSELAALPEEISKYEPESALNGGKYGTELIGELLTQVAGKVNEGAEVLLEIGIGQEEEIGRIAAANSPGARINLIKDLSGINRVLKIELSSFDNHIGLL